MFLLFKRLWWIQTSLLILLCMYAAHAATPMPTDSRFNISLDGKWRFKLEQGAREVKRPDNFGSIVGMVIAPAEGVNRPDNFGLNPIKLPEKFETFYLPDYIEDASWHDMNIPSNWEIAGYSPATYEHPDNASAFYRKTFVVPESWQGRIVKVNFDGVQNGAEIWLNGHPIPVTEPSWGRENYHESGWTAWQADLTQYAKFGQENLLALRVSKNTKSADLDDGDFFVLGGIYRPVTLFSVPQKHIKDFTVRTRILGDGRAEVKTSIMVTGESGDNSKISMNVEGEQPVVGTTDAQGNLELKQIISHPRLWSAEFPNLYEMVIELSDSSGNPTEQIIRQIGIREVTIKDGILLINGTRVKLTGICCHEIYATEGAAVGEELLIKDLKLMKQANINAIRTSHYPYSSIFYDLCDKMGFYVIDELPYCWLSDPRSPINQPGDKRCGGVGTQG